jgi:RNA polymerase sigma factor (sigma-70 family)
LARRIDLATVALEHQSDAELAVRAADGEREAFEELYRRHSRTAMRVAYRVTGNIHDASDAVSDAFARVMQALPAGRLDQPTRFRSYLLTATRHAAVDVLRRSGRAVPAESSELEPPQTACGPSEILIDLTDSAMVATAFSQLPDRWRSVLWLTEVEGIPAREAAGMLGVSANGVAQLAVRARAGLRERFLQAHLRSVDGECREAVDRLGAYVGGALAPRDLTRVDEHLAACNACRDRESDLREIGTTLRRALVPVPLAAGLGRRLWQLLASLAGSGADQVVARVAPVGAAAAVAAVLVGSVASVGVVERRQTVRAADSPVAAAAIVSDVAEPAAAPRVVPTTALSTTTTVLAAHRVATRTTSPSAPTSTTTTSTSTTTTTVPPPAVHRHHHDVEDDVPVDLPVDLPLDVPIDLPELPVPTTLPDLPVIDEVVPEITELHIDAILGTLDPGTISLALAGSDVPLPSPDAPGLPV